MTTLDAMNAIRLTINDPAASDLLRSTVKRYATHDPVDAVADLEHAAKLYRDLSTALLKEAETTARVA